MTERLEPAQAADHRATAAISHDWAQLRPCYAIPANDEFPTDFKHGLVEAIRNNVDYALQPIVNIHTGVVVAYEALLRGNAKIGFETINDLFDTLHETGMLYTADTVLRDLALAKFAGIADAGRQKLFFNLDNRIIEAPDYERGNTRRLVQKYRLPSNAICFEISERHAFSSEHANSILRRYQAQGYPLAIDDFGAGYAGLSLFYEHHPEYVKIDRFFISNLASDHKKKLFVSTIANLAHALGVMVVAEGVETKDEYLAAKDVGCDFAQGYFIAKPEVEQSRIPTRCENVERIATGDKRLATSNKSMRDRQFIEDQIDRVPPISLTADVGDICEAFRRDPDKMLLPVVDPATQNFAGVIREPQLRHHLYSRFGRDLLENKNYSKRVADFVTFFPVADIGLGMEKILEVMHHSPDSDGIVILENARYMGFLSAISMIRIVNERNLFTAQNQNPLSGLPGNATIIEFVNETIAAESESSVLVYLDFDNFKPFNDTYGFRQGDRAIILFTDLLRKRFGATDAFLGHVGGDDFFVGFRGRSLPQIESQIRSLADSFRVDVESFYSAEAREAGYIEVRDRNDEYRRFALMTVSAAVIELVPGPRTLTADALSTRFAELKKLAKKAPGGICAARLD